MSRAVIYLPYNPSMAETWALACIRYVENHDLELAALIKATQTDDRWATVQAMMAANWDLVVVVARPEHIRRDHRYLVVNDQRASRRRPGSRRPQILPR
ncbi:hypothetical protein [Rugosimonospora africana]|uniref:Uncharacterized protein n=1 Tax=Rugosimonospora africana TaxID=556532 RepID=A0A8J3QVW7_9ACTN|nr:hypothetical protein [Rugosimonospora africana]GIH17072.1 hypothetical protein Raf01_52440 [Rugosimonospora africana]